MSNLDKIWILFELFDSCYLISIHSWSNFKESNDFPFIIPVFYLVRVHYVFTRTEVSAFQLQGCYSVLFCPFFLIRTFKTQNVLLFPYKDTHISFYLKLHFKIRKMKQFLRKLRLICVILTWNKQSKIIWNVLSLMQRKKVWRIFILVPSYIFVVK